MRIIIFISAIAFLFSACTTKHIEMKKSPCACFEEIKKAKQHG